MFAFAKKLVTTIEQQASENFQFSKANDHYFSNCPELGLRVLSVQKDSIGSKVKIESWFDYIIKINEYEISIFTTQEGLLDHFRFLQFLNDLVKNKQNLSFQIWSAKGGIQRIVHLPFADLERENEELQEINLSHQQENGNIIINSNPPFANIGISIQLVPLIASTYTWHVLQTHPNSPAYKAGLLPQSDYIIGAQEGLLAFGGEQLLSRVVASRFEKNPHDSSIVLYVYNHDFDVVRPVTIQPSNLWGGQGLLGCDVGYGLLHRIPEVVGKYTGFHQKEEELLDDDDFYVDDFDLAPGKAIFSSNPENVFIPGVANTYHQPHESSLVSPPPPPPPLAPQGSTNTVALSVPPPLRNKKKTTHNANSADILSYLDEETQRSKDLDREISGSKKDSGIVPPPPPPPAPAPST